MAKARELKGRIRTVQNTRKITRTMEMVSTSKLKRAQDRVAAARPHAQRATGGARPAVPRGESGPPAQSAALVGAPGVAVRCPLRRQPAQVRRAAVLLITSNRGLA